MLPYPSSNDLCITCPTHLERTTQRPPRHFLHGPSPLQKTLTGEGRLNSPNPPSSQRAALWKNARRLYEGPRPDRSFRYPRVPKHMSFWQADARERSHFHSGLLPPYSDHLSAASISPWSEVEDQRWARMDLDEEFVDKGPRGRQRGSLDGVSPSSARFKPQSGTIHPNWYRTPTSPNARRSTLPPQMTVSEAGLRLRLLRISSACTIIPQLGTAMQTLLQQEIKAARYREEMALLAGIPSRRKETQTSYGPKRRRHHHPVAPTRSRSASPIAMYETLPTSVRNPKVDTNAFSHSPPGKPILRKRARSTSDDDLIPMSISNERIQPKRLKADGSISTSTTGTANAALRVKSLLFSHGTPLVPSSPKFQPSPHPLFQTHHHSSKHSSPGPDWNAWQPNSITHETMPRHSPYCSSERDHPYLADFMTEEEILERAWMESMGKRSNAGGQDLRKSLLAQCIVEKFARTGGGDLGMTVDSPIAVARAIQNRIWRVRSLDWTIEHESVVFREREERVTGFQSSWRKYRGQLPYSTSSPSGSSSATTLVAPSPRRSPLTLG